MSLRPAGQRPLSRNGHMTDDKVPPDHVGDQAGEELENSPVASLIDLGLAVHGLSGVPRRDRSIPLIVRGCDPLITESLYQIQREQPASAGNIS